MVKCIENDEYDEVRKVYPFFGVTPWYTPMIDDKFIDYFNNPNNSFESKYSNPIFREFYDVIRGMIEGNSWRLFGSREGSLPDFKIFLVSKHFLITCPKDKGEFRTSYINTLNNTAYNKSPKNMTAEELSAIIVDWFRVRMGSSCEIEMAQNGKMGKYLKLLKEKSLQTDK